MFIQVYLDSTIPSDNSSVSLDRYNLICADNLKNIKQGEIFHFLQRNTSGKKHLNNLPD